MADLSVRAMAGLLGVSKSQVDRDRQRGMPMADVEAARAWRLADKDPSRTVDGRIDRAQTPAPNTPPAAVGGLASAAGAGGDDTPPSSPDEASADENTAAYRADRARNERLKAERAELELEQLRGNLVAVRDVEEMQFTAARITRDRVLMVPARQIATLHAALLQLVPEAQREAFAQQIHMHTLERMLEAELRAALDEAAKAIEEARRDDDDPE
jgi:hypothetical protein